MNKLIIAFSALAASSLIGCNGNITQSANTKNSTGTIKTTSTMPDTNYTSTIIVDKTPTDAYNAVKNFRGWWSEDIDGATDKLNEEFFYHYKDVHLCKMKLIEAVPDKRLVYLVLDNQFNFIKDKSEWINTKLIFEISKENNKTKVQFTHEGLTPDYECYNVCKDAWTKYINGSLKGLIENGKGEPNPKGKEGEINTEVMKKWKLK